METNNENKLETPQEDPQGKATHSGWSHFYVLFSKYRDECIKIGQVVLGSGSQSSINYLRHYHSSLYSMAQQIFSFYDSETEKQTTKEWVDLGDEVNETLHFVSDIDFRNQLSSEGKPFVPKELKVKLLMFFNKINRLAAEAGLLVGTEDQGLSEPKKGLVGFRK